MSPPEPSLRQELLDARANLQRQIDRLRDWPNPAITVWEAPFTGNRSARNRELIAKLTESLRQIDDCLVRLEPDDDV